MSSGAWEELYFIFDDFPTLKLVQPEIGSNILKRTACILVFGGPSTTIENMENQVPSMPDCTHICLLGSFNAHQVSDLDERISTLGYLFSLGSGPICQCSKKKQFLIIFSTKDNYASEVHVGKHIPWIQMMLDQLGLPPQTHSTFVTIKIPLSLIIIQ